MSDGHRPRPADPGGCVTCAPNPDPCTGLCNEYTLDDGSTVLFESAEMNLVALHGGVPEIKTGGA